MSSDNCSAAFSVCFSKSGCSDGEQSTRNCWIFIAVQILLSIICVITLIIMHVRKGNDEDKIIVSTGQHRLRNEMAENLRSSKIAKTKSAKLQIRYPQPLTDTFRSENNFMKSNADSEIHFPSKARPEYIPCPDISISEFLSTIFFVSRNDEYVQNRILTCTAFALLSSSASSVLAMVFKYDRWKQDCNNNMEGYEVQNNGSETKEWIMGHVNPFDSAIDSYKFLPIFLLLAYTAFLVERWRTFMILCHTIQGRIQDIGILVGSIPNNPVSEEDKKQLFKVYRLLNVIHIACHKSFMRAEFKNDDELMNQFITMNLLTPEEGLHFGSMGKKIREGLCSVSLCEIDSLIARCDKKCVESKAIIINQKFCELRGSMAGLHDTFVRDNPNEYILAMRIMVFFYEFLVVTGYPLLMYSDSTSGIGCVQPLAFFGTFFTLLSLQMPFILFVRLDNPFDAQDDIKAENLVASTELALFQSMRCQFSSGSFLRPQTKERLAINNTIIDLSSGLISIAQSEEFDEDQSNSINCTI